MSAGDLNVYRMVANNPVHFVDFYGLDRRFRAHSYHSYISVDTYDKNGKKNGKKSLHITDKNKGGGEYTTINGDYPGVTLLTVSSCREADEKLLKDWEEKEKNKTNGDYDLFQNNCWDVSFNNLHFGMKPPPKFQHTPFYPYPVF